MHLVMDLLNIMVNGPSFVYTEYRFAIYQLFTSLKTYFWSFLPNSVWLKYLGLLLVYSGACFCGFLRSQPCNAFPWLAVIFHPSVLQVASKTNEEGIL